MKILANDGLDQSGIDALTEKGFEVITTKVPQESLVDYINENKIRTVLVRSATQIRKELIDACPSIEIIGRGGVGMDNIDVDYARSKNIHVINTPSASSESSSSRGMTSLPVAPARKAPLSMSAKDGLSLREEKRTVLPALPSEIIGVTWKR